MSFTIYPAIDLRGGKVVRLKEGDPSRMTSYSEDPSETARRWLGLGAAWLHVVNLDGAFGEADDANRSALETILNLGAQVQFGGGMRTVEAVGQALRLGVSRAVLGTIAVEQPQIVGDALKAFGPDKVAVGIDARDGRARVRGWKDDSHVSAAALAGQMQALGLRTIIFTDVGRDGLGSGLNIRATQELARFSGLDVIASGGADTIEDIRAARGAGLSGVVIGRALYEGTIDLAEALRS